jgi:hypothetical protein
MNSAHTSRDCSVGAAPDEGLTLSGGPLTSRSGRRPNAGPCWGAVTRRSPDDLTEAG